MIQDRDKDLLRAYLRHEAEAYHWQNGLDGPECLAFQKRLFDEILAYKPAVKVDHIIIESCTNMGDIDSRLCLTPAEWGFKDKADLLITMGTTPRDSLNFNLVERQVYGLRGWNSETNKMEL